jgi:hypothetical protein
MVAEVRKFSDLKRPLSVVFEGLRKRGMLQPVQDSPKRPAPEGVDQSKFCAFHQVWGHDTDNCLRLRHEIQNLIDSGKLEDPSNRKPNIKTNPLPAHDKAVLAISAEYPEDYHCFLLDVDIQTLDIWDELPEERGNGEIKNEVETSGFWTDLNEEEKEEEEEVDGVTRSGRLTPL